MTCVSPRTHEVWYAALAPLEMPRHLPDGRKANGSHASVLKLGEIGLWQRFPVLFCALHAVFSGRARSPVTCSCAMLCCSASCADQVAW